jgi:hypothetical protein
MKNKKRQNHSGYARVGLIMILGIIILLLSSCGVPAQFPGVKITTMPLNVTAGDVTISVDISNFATIYQTAEPNAVGSGHLIFYMDTPVPTFYDHSAFSKAGTYAVEFASQHTWSNVAPGLHTFSVQLVNNDSTPLPSPVVDTVQIEVNQPAAQPAINIMLPQDPNLAPGNITIAVDVANFIVSDQSFGAINRTGQGHLIYYLDDTPPTDAGVPAKTDTSIISGSLRHMWKGIHEGQHTLSVQLVNNDDTPLATPVVATVAITVAVPAG